MNADQLLTFLRDELKESGHPEIKAVSPPDVPGLRVDCTDGTALFANVVHVGKAGTKPALPIWPQPAAANGDRR